MAAMQICTVSSDNPEAKLLMFILRLQEMCKILINTWQDAKQVRKQKAPALTRGCSGLNNLMIGVGVAGVIGRSNEYLMTGVCCRQSGGHRSKQGGQ